MGFSIIIDISEYSETQLIQLKDLICINNKSEAKYIELYIEEELR